MSIYLPTDFCFTKVIYKREDCDFKTGEIPDAFTAQGLKEAREILRVDALSEEERKIYKRYLESVRLALSLDDSSRYEGYCDGHIDGRAEGEKIGIEKGRAEGEKIGLEKGRTEQLVESIKNLISAGFDFDRAVEVLKVQADQIEELRRLI